MTTASSNRIIASQYYFHRSYVPTYYWVYIFLEQWLASTVFRNDTSRVFMSSNEYAFRRRFELTDMSKSYDDIEASSLRFPFANYWPQNTGWVPDERLASNTASLVYLGIYEGNTKIRAASVVHSIPVQFYFDREDDARLAYDTLLFYTYNEHYYSTDIPYGTNSTYEDGSFAQGNTLSLPINITLKGINFNPTFKEKEWLNSNRIFVITADVECRSYIITPPTQPDYSIDSSSTFENDNYKDGIISYYPVEDVIFNIANKAWDVATIEGGKENFPERGNTSTLYVDSSLPPNIKESEEAQIIPPSNRYWLWNNFSKSYEIYNPYEYDVDTFRVYQKTDQNIIEVDYLYFKGLTSTTGEFNWSVNNVDQLREIQITLDNLKDTIVLDPSKESYKLSKLIPNSLYYAYFTFISKNGTPTKLRIEFETRKEYTDSNANSLVGLTW